MARRSTTLLKGGTALLAALWLAAAPTPALAQWWEDEDAYEVGGEDGLFADQRIYQDEGAGAEANERMPWPGEDEVALRGDNELYDDEELGVPGGIAEEQDFGAYYDEDFDEEGWGDWF